MMEKLYQLFEDILRNDNNASEYLKLELVRSDSNFKSEFDLYKYVRTTILYMNDAYINEELRPTLSGLSDKYFKQETKKRTRSNNYTPIAACFLLLLGALLFLMNGFEKANLNKELAGDYFIPELSTSRSANHKEDLKVYIKANTAFKNGSFEEATRLYKSVLHVPNRNKELVEWNLLLSMLASEDDGYTISLNAILNNKNHSMYDKALNLSNLLDEKN